MPHWDWRWQSEIEAFPRSVLMERFGSVEADDWRPGANGPALFGDFTAITAADLEARGIAIPQILVAGTPCQAFSIAGKRESLADDRGNLTLAFVDLVHDLASRPDGLRCVVWENVPGVLNTEDNAFGCFLGGLVGSDDALRSPLDGGKWPSAGMVAGPRARACWRVLDAQYFGLAQRRERVFVVIDLGGGPDPAAVLFERQGLRGNSPPSREAGEGTAGVVGGGPAGGRISGTVSSKWAKGSSGPAGDEVACMVAHALRPEGHDASEDGTGRGTPIIPVAFDTTQITSPLNRSVPKAGDPCHPLAAKAHPPAIAFPERMSATQCASAEDISPALGAINPTAVAFQERGRDGGRNVEWQDDLAYSLNAPAGGGRRQELNIATQWAVRRLTPTECERLQGLQDGHTLVTHRNKPAADGPRYKGIGNGMAVSCMRWILQRVEAAWPSGRSEAA